MATTRKKKIDRRFEVTETCQDIGMGPLGFDAAQARRAGWTVLEIERIWKEIATIYLRVQKRVQKRNPHLYHIDKNGNSLFLGPDENGHTIDRKKLKGL